MAMRWLLRGRGFTLVELLVAVALVAILAAVALPSFERQLARGHRAAAQAAMLDIASRQQHLLLAGRHYADAVALESSGYRLDPAVARHYAYRIEVSHGEAPGFRIVFTPRAPGAAPLTLDDLGLATPVELWHR